MNPRPSQLSFSFQRTSAASLLGTVGNRRARRITTRAESIDGGRRTTTITKALKRLDDAGIAVALDDFGTGHASLSHLRRFPVSWPKIDRSVISNGAADEDARTIVRAVIGLAHGLGLKAVTEGVETSSQMEFTAESGCDLAQGYLIARPMAGADVSTFLAGWRGCPGTGERPS